MKSVLLVVIMLVVINVVIGVAVVYGGTDNGTLPEYFSAQWDWIAETTKNVIAKVSGIIGEKQVMG